MKPIVEMTQEEMWEEMKLRKLLLEADGIGLKILIALQGAVILQEMRTYEGWRAFSALVNKEAAG